MNYLRSVSTKSSFVPPQDTEMKALVASEASFFGLDELVKLIGLKEKRGKMMDMAEFHRLYTTGWRNFSGFHFDDCDFSCMNLADLDCGKATFTNCTFERSELSKCSFQNASISNTDFSDAKFNGLCSFNKANGVAINFSRTKFENVNFSSFTMNNCILDKTVVFCGSVEYWKLVDPILANRIQPILFGINIKYDELPPMAPKCTIRNSNIHDMDKKFIPPEKLVECFEIIGLGEIRSRGRYFRYNSQFQVDCSPATDSHRTSFVGLDGRTYEKCIISYNR